MASEGHEHRPTVAPYRAVIDDRWDTILMVYRWHQDKHPILEYDLEAQQIPSYPAVEYINPLHPMSVLTRWLCIGIP